LVLRVRQHLGKYRIERRLADGGFAAVYQAYDTVTGIRVALKTPHPSFVTRETLDEFRKEVRLTAKLDHANILAIKDAGFVNDTFIIVQPLGIESLADRLRRRTSAHTILEFTDQMLDAVAFAHKNRVMHCDIKPENFILFEENRLRLADFGIARVAQRTLQASGAGTIGYVAPEQAMGRPSFRSDVFSLGLILYRMFSGQLPEWPYAWPPPGFDRVRRNIHPQVIAFLRRSLEVDASKRFADAMQMLAAYHRLRPRVLRSTLSRRRKRRAKAAHTPRDWRTIRHVEFLKQFRTALDLRDNCRHCHGPVSDAMQSCPWCGKKRRIRESTSRFPAQCPRCNRGMKSDWRFCPWCHGAAINPDSTYRYSDARYEAKCGNPGCKDKVLMPFMRYCPWCSRKVARRWRIAGSEHRCPRCGWGVAADYWDYCAWCGRMLRRA
jgi:serine/threonine-protein kinase